MSALPANLYALIGDGLRPLVPAYLRWRAGKGKEEPARLGERYGLATRPRPTGRLLWLHGASVGESLSALPLIERLLALNPALHILVTSGTVTSAKLLAQKLPARAFHQYIPLDAPAYARRFLAHWKPDAALWLESELWPNLIAQMTLLNIPAARVNTRLTAKSATGWQRLHSWFARMHKGFAQVLAIADADAARLTALGIHNVHTAGNLKLTVPTPATEATASTALRYAIGERPVWLFANSHAGEEEIALRVHKALAADMPDLLTLIVPRHTARADAVATLLGNATPRRSQSAWPRTDQPFYLGDSMGEMGLYYGAAGIVCVGGSFTPKGGHNPIEPAQCGCAVIIGPDTSKCEDLTELLATAGALTKVTSEAELIVQLRKLLTDKTARDTAQAAARLATSQQEQILAQTLAALAPVLGRAGVATA